MPPTIENAVRFLTTIFQPGDVFQVRPIETWVSGGEKQSRIDYDGICYHKMGIRRGNEWLPYLPSLESFLTRIIERSSFERTNVFMGVAPRFARGDSATYELAWQIRTIRSLWSDIDDTPDVATAVAKCGEVSLPPPSIVVSSGHGAHLYWLLDSPYLIDDYSPPDPYPVFAEFHDQGEGKKMVKKSFYLNGSPERLYLDVPTHRPHLSPKARYIQDALAGIAAAIGGDHTHDLTRILRLPDTLNRKNERNGTPPIPCTLISCDPSCRYPLSLFSKFSETSPQKIDRERIAVMPLPKPKKLGTRGQSRLDSLIADCVAADTGTRSETDFALCCWGVENGQLPDEVWRSVSGIGKFAEAGRRYFDLTWAAACGHTREKIYTNARKKLANRQEAKSNTADFASNDPETIEEAPDDPHRLARINLERYATCHNGRTIKLWRDAWYAWKRNAYRKITEKELRAKITRAIKVEFDRLNLIEQDCGDSDKAAADAPPPSARKVSVSLVSNVVQATSGLPGVCIPSNVEHNTWLPTRERRAYIAMRNGILNIQAVVENRDDYMLSSSSDWFSMVSLDYDFILDADCPKWIEFLRYNLEDDPERIDVAQEWAGYLLTPSTDEQKFMVLEGEGKNGKSVFIAALTAMLGPENVSNVALENFGDRFQRTDTIGKLLNAAGDCGELDKAAEGLLKSFISGDRMYFDRKGVDGMNCPPTARLMIAANNRPRFNDRSDGIWRRMLAMPWQIEVPEGKCVRGMDKIGWWQRSGELPGIFRWALVGLARLQQQHGFTRSSVMDQTLNDYKEEMNPARTFLTENLEETTYGEIASNWLYHLYKKWAESAGYHPLASRTFFKEVVRVFKKAKRAQRGQANSRFRVYSGIQFTQESICGEKTADQPLLDSSF